MSGRVVLVDGTAVLYRQFHALPPLHNAQGEPTQAVYGLMKVLERLIKDYPDARFAIVFDAGGPTFRHEAFAGYKAQRSAMPDDLVRQIPPALELVEALGWPLFRVAGVEADDVLATLATHAAERGEGVLIVTNDKDLAQLVGGPIALLDPVRHERIGPEDVRARYGVDPERIVDYLALVGDSSDNIPGLRGVGPKTAARWLETYGSLAGILEHARELGARFAPLLAAEGERLLRNTELIRLRRNVPLPPGTEELRVRPADGARLAALGERLGIRAGFLGEARRARADSEGTEETISAPVVHVLRTRGELERWIGRFAASALLAVDTETTALDYLEARLVGLALADRCGEACYVPLAHEGGTPTEFTREEALALLRPLLEGARPAKIGHHTKYDRHVLANHGLDFGGVRDDTMLESYVLDATDLPHSLDAVARRLFDARTTSYESLTRTAAGRRSFAEVPLEEAAAYAGEDVDLTLRVHHVLGPRLAAAPPLERLYRTLEMPLAEVLYAMERHGVLVDTALLAAQNDELGRELESLRARAYEAAGTVFNLDSPPQIRDLLFGKLQLRPRRRTPGGEASTSEEVLEELAAEHELPRILLAYRSLAKLRSTYTEQLPRAVRPETGRIHTQYHQAATATGRLSSSHPNLQNIPVRTPEGRRIRRAFRAPEGYRLLSFDYSQIELRLMAHLSGDEGLREAFRRGLDVHRAVAAEIFGRSPESVTEEERRSAKAINFGLIYGMSPHGLARALGTGLGEARAYIENYFGRYPRVRTFMEETRLRAREDGFVTTLLGRRLPARGIRDRSAPRRQAAERAAINAPLQGSAAEIIKLAMIAVYRHLGAHHPAAHLILQVHDELVIEAPEEETSALRKDVSDLMNGVVALAIPLVVDVGEGSNWDEAH
jgi:DNA polymerase-1